MGVAWTYDSCHIYFTSIKGTPYEHLNFIKQIAQDTEIELYVEKLNFFRNANTVRSLLLKTGYVIYSLSNSPQFVSVPLIRKRMGFGGKKETLKAFQTHNPDIRNDDESDAIALLLYVINKDICSVTTERWC